MLGLLSLLAVLFFLSVTGLTRVYYSQRESLGNRWYNRGLAELQARQYDAAVTDFRAALLYSRDNYAYQLSLAEALLGQKRTGQAYAYLLNLWDRQPEDGLVNLELARIAAQKGQIPQAVRYYHNAIYAAWSSDEENKRRDARLELIELLLRNNERAQAESEVIALEANADDEPREQLQIGDFFVRTLDYERALAAYRASLKSDRHNPAALAGAGRAAFELSRYPLALKYLQGAAASNPADTDSASRLQTTELVLRMDPFQRQLPATQRDRIVVEAFAAAGSRLQNCRGQQKSASSAGSQSSLPERYARMKPRITEPGLQRNPDLVEQAMDLVFDIERQTSATCGTPTGTDLALLLISNLREGNL